MLCTLDGWRAGQEVFRLGLNQDTEVGIHAFPLSYPHWHRHGHFSFIYLLASFFHSSVHSSFLHLFMHKLIHSLIHSCTTISTYSFAHVFFPVLTQSSLFHPFVQQAYIEFLLLQGGPCARFWGQGTLPELQEFTAN